LGDALNRPADRLSQLTRFSEISDSLCRHPYVGPPVAWEAEVPVPPRLTRVWAGRRPRAVERRGRRTAMAPGDKARKEALPADDRDTEHVAGQVRAHEETAGLRRGLTARHIRFMALGSAIGTGLFMGSSESIQAAGPAVLLVYIIGGAAVFMVMRA